MPYKIRAFGQRIYTKGCNRKSLFHWEPEVFKKLCYHDGQVKFLMALLIFCDT